MKLQTIIRVIKYEGATQFYLNKKQDWVEFRRSDILDEEFLELEHNVEIIQDSTTILDTKSLIEQKEKDKNCHIKDLNSVVYKLIDSINQKDSNTQP